MARAVQRKARKDYPQNGIAKGDLYWFAQIKTGPRSSRILRQKEPFRRSQLTTSDFLGQLYDIEDSLAAITHDENMPDALRQIADDLRTLGSEQDDKFNNMPDGLQQGDTGQMLEERAQNCESWADEIEQAADELAEKIETINAKEPADLDELGYDPDEEDAEEPTEEEIQEARDNELSAAYQEAEEAASSNPF